MTRDELLQQAMALDASERYELGTALLESVETADDDEPLSAEWMAEIHRRIEASDRGEMKMIPAEEALAELRRRMDARRAATAERRRA